MKEEEGGEGERERERESLVHQRGLYRLNLPFFAGPLAQWVFDIFTPFSSILLFRDGTTTLAATHRSHTSSLPADKLKPPLRPPLPIPPPIPTPP